MLSTGHGQTHTEENNTKLGCFHTVHQVLPQGQRVPCFPFHFNRVEVDALRQGPQCPQGFEIFTRLDLYENVSRLGTLGLADINDHTGPVLPTVGQKHTFGHQAVLREMTGMTFSRIAAPKHDHVTPVANFT